MPTDQRRYNPIAAKTQFSSPPRPQQTFEMGPDFAGPQSDVRKTRPYFLVPLPQSSPDDPGRRNTLDKAAERIRNWVRAEETANRPITDIFILSHGWHRNFFSGVSAYDRLSSRLGHLLYTGRLHPPGSLTSDSPDSTTAFRPLFLNLHWHSDPGEDGWVDQDGRRDKASFMRNVEAVFARPAPNALPPDPTPADFTPDFEALFELFSEMSAPGIDALSATEIAAQAPTLTQRLDQYAVQEDGKATLSDKVTILWTCYYEAQPKGFLVDQEQKARRRIGFTQAVFTLVNFVIGIVGIATVMGMFFNAPHLPAPGDVRHGLVDFSGKWFHVPLQMLAATWYRFLQFLQWLLIWVLIVTGFQLCYDRAVQEWKAARAAPAGFWLALPSVLYILIACALAPRFYPLSTAVKFWPLLLAGALLYLLKRAVQRQNAIASTDGGRSQSRGALSLPVLAWAFAQVLLAAPLLLFCFATYFVERPAFPLFNERKEDINKGGLIRLRERLAELARVPNVLVQDVLSTDNPVASLRDAIDTQLAFFEMQRGGVQAGVEAAAFLRPLLDDLPNARLHFIGHSFGGLVVCNAARELAPSLESGERRIQTLCLLEAALSSDWFAPETLLRARINTLAAIYSQYDTANGFWYPAANNGRMALGFVGFCPAPGFVPERQGRYAMLVRTPALGISLRPVSPPRLLSIDASRLIYAGAVAAGGGHDDIFKDDVIYLLWSVTGLEQFPLPQ